MLEPILKLYGLDSPSLKIEAFGSGLINSTWKVSATKRDYILQKVNDLIFTNPYLIANNITKIEEFLTTNNPEYNFISPVKSIDGKEMIDQEGTGYFRLFPFVKGSHTIDVVASPEQAYEAASQFGKFTYNLKGFDATKLETTINDFHNLSLRYNQFLDAIKKGNPKRILEIKELIDFLKTNVEIVSTYEKIKTDPEFKIRVTHHDTKISNVLFDEKGKGICVIDLDTVMPGYFFSDVGDMMRTYLSPVNEDEKDFSKIEIRDAFYKAIVSGYKNEMKEVLTDVENEMFYYAGQFMIYMQALRFITDYLNDDIYYSIKYPAHNLIRAHNQIVLLQKYLEKKSLLLN